MPEIESFFDVERIDFVEKTEDGAPVVQREVELKSIVISLGGSLFFNEIDGIPVLNTAYLNEVGELFKTLSSSYDIFIVVGGGKIAKDMIKRIRGIGANESSLDALGISMTRVNALALKCVMGIPGLSIPEDFDTAIADKAHQKVVVMGGTHPGHTTDAVAAMLAETAGSSLLIIATDVDGIFSADPKVDETATMYEELSPRDLVLLTAGYGLGAGSRSPIDPMAAKIISRTAITTYILNGGNTANIESAILGREFTGTRVMPEGVSIIRDDDIAQKLEEERQALAKKTSERRAQAPTSAGPAEATTPSSGGRRLLLGSRRKQKEGTAEEPPEEPPEEQAEAEETEQQEAPPEDGTPEEEPKKKDKKGKKGKK